MPAPDVASIQREVTAFIVSNFLFSNTAEAPAPATSFSSGEMVTLTSHAGSGATFSGWGGDCWGTSSCTLTMSAARNVTATFTGSTPGSYWLTVSKTGTGNGTVTSSPTGISCGSTCSKSFSSGTPVTLTASAAGGSSFAGWGGACGGSGTCSVTMSAAKNVTATFNQTTVPPSSAGSLIRQTGHDEVFWRQNGYIYHVTEPSILDMMQAVGIPGWSSHPVAIEIASGRMVTHRPAGATHDNACERGGSWLKADNITESRQYYPGEPARRADIIGVHGIRRTRGSCEKIPRLTFPL